MHTRLLVLALATLWLLVPTRVAAAADDATLLRVFLSDGTSLVSYGELARVGDRVVFSMPTSAGPNPALHLVNLAAERVDWERTNRYAASARAARYLETQADDDYAALSKHVAQALNEIVSGSDPAKRLEIAELARKKLAEWPQSHYNSRQVEVRQMLSMLDEAIADLRAASGTRRFDLSLFAFAEPPVIVEPLLPPPTLKEAIEQVLTAARAVDLPAERTSLLSAALGSLERDSSSLPAAWVNSTRAEAKAALNMELQLDRSYQSLTRRIVMLADYRARVADVRGLERLMTRVHERDASLGAKRLEAVNSLVAAVQARLDAARQLRLARDHWALRATEFRKYRIAMRSPIDLFARLKPALESIRSLSGTSPASLSALERAVNQIIKQVSAITPPDEFRAAHALLVSAAQLAASAGKIRREATLASDVSRAWDASSAAAGALMLGSRARNDIQALLRPPQLP